MSALTRHAFDTPGGVLVRASLSSPDVDVETWAEPVTEVELLPGREDGPTLEAIEATRVEHRVLRDGRHEVSIRQRRRGLVLGRGPAFLVRVRCPERTELEVAAASSDVRCRGGLDAASVKGASSDVSLDAVRGRVDVDTASGDVAIGSCAALDAKLVSGDLRVGEVHGPLAVTTVSGDVEVHAFAGDGARIRSVSGDVALDVVPGRRLHLDVSSVSGDIASALDPADGPPPEGALVDVHVRTVSGDIRLGRASHAGAAA